MATIDEKYKKIPLSLAQVEEYELGYDNIGEITIKIEGRDISKDCKVIFRFSKEALIGFGIYAVRLYNTFREYYHYQIEPLGESLSNQAMGFFLTPGSPELVIGCKDFGDLNGLGFSNKGNINKGKKNYSNFDTSFLVDLEFDNEYFEYHNLGFCNVGDLKVLYKNEDISPKCYITLMLSKSALLGLGTELLRLAHNFIDCKSLDSYPIEEHRMDCQLGFFLTQNSAALSVECKRFQNALYYDNKFGDR